ncbi:GH92 family glycosyl hydrolase [Mycobacterium sp. SVM_VP21]|nr:GH92 family glycosyl hydrolase [Mycobacterium sp. SVM_VP21]
MAVHHIELGYRMQCRRGCDRPAWAARPPIGARAIGDAGSGFGTTAWEATRSRRAAALLLTALALTVGLIAAPPTSHEYSREFVANPVDYVRTLIGTGAGDAAVGEINNFPGASVPFGMVQYSPDTVGSYAGYRHDEDVVTGLSMTHASVGCAAFGDIAMLPTTELAAQPWNTVERMAHDGTEVGLPGYYAMRFPDTRVTAELTATTRTGVGRFSYPDKAKAAVMFIRSGASLAGNSAASIEIGTDNTTVTGSATSGGFCSKNNVYTVFFAMRFSMPFIRYGTWDGYSVYPAARRAYSSYTGSAGGYVEFPAGALLEVHIGLSYVSVEGARANLAEEGQGSFDEVRQAASAKWNAALSRIRVAGADTDDLKTFYTALYHSLLHPNTFNDVNGRYIGFDQVLHKVAAGRTQYANFSDWDTYRGQAALHGLLFPRQASDMAQSLIEDAKQSGAFPRWALANAATAEMTGDSVVPLIVNLYTFGAKGFDARTGLDYMVRAATRGGVGRNGYVERPGIDTYLERGYFPQLAESCLRGAAPGASITLEWSVDDFAISRFADALGQSATADEFQRRSHYWQNLFNPTTHAISPRGTNGFFPEGPAVVEPPPGCFSQIGFDEGNAEQYLWWVPHDVAGLVTALGGRQATAQRLDRFTSIINAGPNEPHLWVGNEPGFGVPWLFNYVGQPWKTQRLVDQVRGTLFGPRPDGEPGNDDLGAMSSWYVWAALGLYPSTPGTSILTVNTPLFDRAEITLPGGRFIRLSAPGASGRHRLRYIDGLSIDGRERELTALPESIVTTGGDLSFVLTARPNTKWATAEHCAPASFSTGSSALAVNVVPGTVVISPGASRTVAIDLQRMIDAPADYTVTAESDQDGINATALSGQLDSDGSGAATATVAVAATVPAGNYPLVLSAALAGGTRTFTVLVVVT